MTEYWADFVKDAVAAIAGAGFGAWLGARAAFRLEREKAAEAHADAREKAARELLERRAAAGNMAMFALARMHNDLVCFKHQHIDPADRTRAPWFFQNGVDLPVTNSHKFDIEGLGFLFESRDPEMPLKLAIQEDNFMSLADTLRRRNIMHQEEAVPAITSIKRPLSELSEEDLRDAVGLRIYSTLTNYASDVRVLVERGIQGTMQAANELRTLLKEMHPGYTIIGFNVPPGSVPSMSPIEAARQALSRSRGPG